MTFDQSDLLTWRELRADRWTRVNREQREVPNDEPWELVDGELLTISRTPFAVPAELEHLAPDDLLALAAAHRSEQYPTQQLVAATPAKPARMTVGRALEMLLESRGRAGTKSGAVTIGRSARGVVTWEVTATADPDELEHLTAALDDAIAAHDRLAELYPMTEGE